MEKTEHKLTQKLVGHLNASLSLQDISHRLTRTNPPFRLVNKGCYDIAGVYKLLPSSEKKN